MILGIAVLGACAPFLRPWVDPGIIVALGLLVYPLIAVGFWAGMLYVRWLAPRIPNGRVHARAKVLLVLFASVVGAVVLTILLSLVSGGSPRGDAVCLGIAVFLGTAVASVVALIMYCRMFFQLRAALMDIAAAQQGAQL
jgi:hypothetical protein